MTLDYGPDSLESLLERLFADDEPTPEDIVVLGRPAPFGSLAKCCNYSYASY